MRVACLQFDVRRDDFDANWRSVEAGLGEARERGVDLVVLPEMWTTSFAPLKASPNDPLAASEELTERLRQASKELDLAVCGTGYARCAESGATALPFNRAQIFARGQELLRYDKIHLFSPAGETENFTAGQDPPATVELTCAQGDSAAPNNLASSVSASVITCYDLRFPELARWAFRSGAELLLCPAQWPDTRETHWRTLVQARAVELQGFLVATNRTGCEIIGRKARQLDFPGNSLIADPNGQILAQGEGQAGLIVADLDLSVARQMRRRVPVHKDDRPELYSHWRQPEDKRQS